MAVQLTGSVFELDFLIVVRQHPREEIQGPVWSRIVPSFQELSIRKPTTTLWSARHV